MTVEEDIRISLRSRAALIAVVTIEEQRAIAILDDIRRERDPASDLVAWDIADGFASKAGRNLPAAATPALALDKIRQQVQKNPDRRDLYVLKDFHEFWSKDPLVRRKLRSLAQLLVYTGASLVVTTPKADTPVELGDDLVVLELDLPDEATLRTELDALIDNTAGLRDELTEHGRGKLAQAALGLTVAQAKRAFAKAIVRDAVLDDRDIDIVIAEKKAAIRESQALEFFTPAEGPDDLGGLDALKQWLSLRERAFDAEAAAYGLPAPKGLALIGIPGTGKSLTAKMIGGLWQLPLLRLDVGALFGSLIGESEERVRRALRLAEAVAPCVLWIDEIEKALSSGDLDGGTSRRVFGTILTWMQEKTAPVFVVATANGVASLPPETMRRGRFDEIFFLDLPNETERRDIITVHLRKRRREPGNFNIGQLARMSDGYTGAELEQAIVDAMYGAFDNGADITTADIVGAIQRTVPLSQSQREEIEQLRSWLRDGRAQSASAAPDPGAEPGQVRLELS